jgi:glutathione S-transferase
MLEEVGLTYSVQPLVYGASMHAAEYRAINPMGKVPSLHHNDQIITEVAAICAYLAEAVPEAGLAPLPHERADYYRWLFFAAGPVESALTNRAMGWDPEGPKRGMFGYGHFGLMQDTFAWAVGRHPYITGDRFTAADV